jgi:hypothetical protein
MHFTFIWPRIITNLFIIKPNRPTNFTNLFWYETLHVSDSSSVHHQVFIHCTLSNGICHTAFEQDQDGTAVPSWSCSKPVYRPVWQIPLLSLEWINSWWWTEELSETCRVSCQDEFVKFVGLVGFITKIECMYGWMNEWMLSIWSGVNRSLRGEKTCCVATSVTTHTT